MIKLAVVKTGGKQYLVKEKDILTIDNLGEKENEIIDLETLAVFGDQNKIELGKPNLAQKTKAKIIKNLKGEKIRVSKFKAKVRYRRVRGFRPLLTQLQIEKII